MEEHLSVDERFVRKLHEIVEARMADEAFGVPELSEAMGLSRVTLYRKLRQSVNKPASRFLNEIRLQRGKELLENREGTVAEIAYRVGFRSASYFNKCFHGYYGHTPGEILKGKHDGEITTNRIEPTEREPNSIVVLPFRDDGPTVGQDHVADGLREEIIHKLNLIGDIHVISRTSSDTYRYSTKNLKAIARELQVNYILEGSYQKIRNVIRLRIQLIGAASDFHLWSQPYEIELDGGNLFEIQKDVALRVAWQLKAKITPEEKHLLKNSGTESPVALTHYQKGIGYSMLAKNEKRSRLWDKAVDEFEQAVSADPAFADAWLRLAEITVYNKMLPNRYLTGFLDLKSFNDTLFQVIAMLEKANASGTQNPELTLFIDSLYTSSREDFLEILNKSLDKQRNTADHGFFRTLGYISYLKGEYYHAIKYWLTYLKLISGKDIPSVDDFHFIISTVALAGYPGEAWKIADLALRQTGDMLRYNYSMLPITAGTGDGSKFNQLVIRLHREYPEDPVFANFAMNICVSDRDAKRALVHLQKRVELLKKNKIPIDPNPYMAWVYYVIGREADFRWHVERILENKIGLEEDVVVPNAAFLFCHLAATFALSGQRNEMYACLDHILQCESALMDVILQLKAAPHFDPYRYEVEFDALVIAIEGKYESVYQKCKELLNGGDFMLITEK